MKTITKMTISFIFTLVLGAGLFLTSPEANHSENEVYGNTVAVSTVSFSSFNIGYIGSPISIPSIGYIDLNLDYEAIAEALAAAGY